MPSEPVAGDATQRDRRRPTACLMQLQVAKESLCFAGCCPPGAVVELLLAAGEQCLTDETLAAAEERHGPHSVVLNQHATHLLKIMHATLKYRVSHFSEMKGGGEKSHSESAAMFQDGCWLNSSLCSG